ncbi:MAG: hypothetical protein ACODAC_08600 [Pseudomonadota bacterium]
MFNAMVAGMEHLWLAAAACVIALAALGVSAVVLRRAARERRRLDGMRRDLEVFAEASTRVADTVDHLLHGTVSAGDAGTTSRRYLLVQARHGLEQGERVEALADRFGLCDDERRLLEFLSDAGRGASRSDRAREPAAAQAWVA